MAEVGVQNFFVLWINEKGKEELITHPLDGTIVPGIMRDTVIKQAKAWGVNVVEKYFTISQLIEANNEHRLIEAFGTGTASIITSYGSIKHNDQVIFKLLKLRCIP